MLYPKAEQGTVEHFPQFIEQFSAVKCAKSRGAEAGGWQRAADRSQAGEVRLVYGQEIQVVRGTRFSRSKTGQQVGGQENNHQAKHTTGKKNEGMS